MIAITSLTLHCIVPEKNMRRWYRHDVQSDLFGYQCLVCEWGRIGRSGQTCIVPYPTITEAQAAFEKQRARKEKKGYVPV
jgi:predicted DNA-binding WGR domain protein